MDVFLGFQSNSPVVAVTSPCRQSDRRYIGPLPSWEVAPRPTKLELTKARLNPCGHDMSTVADAFAPTNCTATCGSARAKNRTKKGDRFFCGGALFFYAAEKPEKSTRRGTAGGYKTAPAQGLAAMATRIFSCGRYRGLLAIWYFSVVTWRLKWADSCRFASFWRPFFVWF
jgi:hypothetical protein